MNRIVTTIGFPDEHGLSPRRLGAIALVTALHGLLAYALVTGIAIRAITEVPVIIEAEVMKMAPPKEVALPPPPPQMTRPALPAIPPPLVRIEQPAAATTAITAVTEQTPPKVSHLAARPAPPAPPAPRAVAPPTPPSAIASTHTVPPYPPIARRLNEQGTVALLLTISAGGEVLDAVVERSSGSSRLDQVAADWIRQHWRYRPATREGHAVPAKLAVNVRFDLRDAR